MSDENFNRKLYVFVWHDKIDKTYLSDSIRIHPSKRAVCRGYIAEFENNKKMNPNEFELCVIGEYNEFTGTITAYDNPEVLNPKMVYAPEEVD